MTWAIFLCPFPVHNCLLASISQNCGTHTPGVTQVEDTTPGVPKMKMAYGCGVKEHQTEKVIPFSVLFLLVQLAL